ncbi:MAG: hypothetical protein ABFS23_10555, partial [Pseudomonadota bacterium]
WFRNGWLRIYGDSQHGDARVLLRGQYLFVGIPANKQVLQYRYALKGHRLVLRDTGGNLLKFRRRRR